ncbi:hypothetical protein OG799_17475 [Micromonospora sp. NBC_00898]|uniref:hypothetical protein n=1 Tax=Micromonospora sp. NBC_00898 TaxID=2975981 RepID=UPI00386D33AE|nr:hypothetical protein OG799_17475 [Micromonospora sp. NBC_00898]
MAEQLGPVAPAGQGVLVQRAAPVGQQLGRFVGAPQALYDVEAHIVYEPAPAPVG